MRLTGLFWWIGAFVSAGLASMLTYGLLKPMAPVVDAPALVTRPVVVAAVDIPFRRSISADELVIRELPVESLPEGAAVTLDQVEGKMATVALFANAPILAQQLVTPDIVTQQVALSIPPGKVVMAVPTQSRLISNHMIRPGDRIELLATVDMEVARAQGSVSMPESIALLRNLEVHAIILSPAPLGAESSAPTASAEDAVFQDQEGGVFHSLEEGAQSVLLAIDIQDALTIRHVLNVGGILDLVLRAPDDESAQEPVPVDQFYLANRYKVNLVR